MTLDEAREVIAPQVQLQGPYSHNILSILLRKAAKEHGYRAADALVDEFELTALFGIPKRGNRP
ncbi:MAG: hypothetical protein GWN58_09665 [Anaerolineae bacterium]|nr:hypothetical protein [Anaerolineae bacterium]